MGIIEGYYFFYFLSDLYFIISQHLFCTYSGRPATLGLHDLDLLYTTKIGRRLNKNCTAKNSYFYHSSVGFAKIDLMDDG